MKQTKALLTVLAGVGVSVAWLCGPQQPGMAQQTADKYVGSETCATCHAETAKKWQLTVHRRTLFNKEASRQGCEACHGPGGDHVAGGGDKSKIIRFSSLKPEQTSAICKKCHTQAETTLWDTSRHARAKVSCIQCHDPHSVGEKELLADVNSVHASVEGLTRAMKQAQLQANTAAPGSADAEKANAEAERLKAERNQAQEKLKGAETLYHRSAEPYVCYNCHKAQEVQSHLPSRHPLEEGKVKCSSCHNPHGGPKGMLRAESVVETCARCHAEKVGPFTFEHPPVTEDCTICHTPHGSVQNKMLAQSQPFLCLKCHAGPHSRRGSLGNPAGVAQYYNNCTVCHTQIHGSDQHSAFHF